MAKKVSDIMTELDISYQELKRNSDKLGIKVTGEGDSMEDRDASRIISTINMLKGNDRPEAQSKKPKIKATPIISKPAPMAKKEEAPKEAPVKAEAPKEEPKKRVGLKIVKTAAEVESEEAAAKAEQKAAKEKEAAEKKAAKKSEKKPEKKTSDKPAEKKAADRKAEEKKPAKKAEEKKGDCESCPYGKHSPCIGYCLAKILWEMKESHGK